MVSKIDQCMLDLMKFHGEEEHLESQEGSQQVNQGSIDDKAVPTPSARVTTASQSPKSSEAAAREAAGNKLASHRPQSPLSDSANSADGDISGSSSFAQTSPEADTAVLPSSHVLPQSTAKSQANSKDDRFL